MRLLLLGHQLLLVTALDDIDDHQHRDHEVEGGFTHRFHGMTKEAQMRFVATFRDQQYSDDKEDEEPQHLVEAVFLQEA